jgi:protein SCO1
VLREIGRSGRLTRQPVALLPQPATPCAAVTVSRAHAPQSQQRSHTLEYAPTLTGVHAFATAQVGKAARAYRVYFSKTADHEEDEDYLVDHSIVMYLVNERGEFVDFYTQRMGVPDCVERLLKELRAGGAV